jgi:phosphatidylserine/phosphatidylglycerophosphate/cardiolipin synthase-like enzyme
VRDDRLYVHAKVGIVDDRWLTIGSANLNAHSLLNDTEMNVVTSDAELVRATRLRLWAEHFEVDVETIAGEDPRTVVDERWHPIAAE